MNQGQGNMHFNNFSPAHMAQQGMQPQQGVGIMQQMPQHSPMGQPQMPSNQMNQQLPQQMGQQMPQQMMQQSQPQMMQQQLMAQQQQMLQQQQMNQQQLAQQQMPQQMAQQMPQAMSQPIQQQMVQQQIPQQQMGQQQMQQQMPQQLSQHQLSQQLAQQQQMGQQPVIPQQQMGQPMPQQPLMMPQQMMGQQPTMFQQPQQQHSPAPQQVMQQQQQFLQQPQQQIQQQMQQQQPQQQQAQKDFNPASLCRIGQETVQELVSRVQECLQLLKNLQPPNGTAQSTSMALDKKNKLDDQLKTVKVLFKRLRIVYNKCNENSQELDSFPLDSMVPTQSNLSDWQYSDRKQSDQYLSALEERKELYDQILVKNRHLQDIMEYMRSIIWEINTMLMMRRP